MALSDLPLRVVLYEGSGAAAVAPEDRFAAISPLLERGFGVTRAGAERPVAPADTSPLLVVGRWQDSPPAADSAQRLRWGQLDSATVADQAEAARAEFAAPAPGGWAWTDLPGGVPDADDTAGALLALRCLGEPDRATIEAAAAGVNWLLGLQNRDGGIPTFCRGWGTLPFDRSTPELTAHALRSWRAWLDELPPELEERTRAAMRRALEFLEMCQRTDGAWLPLWFGNEAASEQENPVYGTAQVLIALASEPTAEVLRERGRKFLRFQQNPDGGWGGAVGTLSTVEETSLALEALAEDSEAAATVEQGSEWLIAAMESGQWQRPAPIGLYFARLWYFERLYPLVFAVSALGRLISKRS